MNNKKVIKEFEKKEVFSPECEVNKIKDRRYDKKFDFDKNLEKQIYK